MSDAGVLILLVLLLLAALMLWRWCKHNDPLPARVRTVVNRTIHRKRHEENELYGVAGVNNNVIKCFWIYFCTVMFM